MKILAMSDQHGHLPAVPPCDLLIVAGDQCPDVIGGLAARVDASRQRSWFENEWLPWRYAQPVGTCVVTWGNHDFCGIRYENFTDQMGDKLTHIVSDNTVEACGLLVYMTPWSNTFMKWAFMRDPDVLARYYANIPTGIDILVSHQPPMGYGSQCVYRDLRDGVTKTEHVGSIELLAEIDLKRPRAVVCGHVHSGFGTYDCNGIPVYNVSVVDEGYSLVHPPTLVELRRADDAVRLSAESPIVSIRA